MRCAAGLRPASLGRVGLFFCIWYVFCITGCVPVWSRRDPDPPTEDELLETDEFAISITYALDRAGVYVFDVTVEDALAVPPTPYRKTLRITR